MKFNLNLVSILISSSVGIGVFAGIVGAVLFFVIAIPIWKNRFSKEQEEYYINYKKMYDEKVKNVITTYKCNYRRKGDINVFRSEDNFLVIVKDIPPKRCTLNAPYQPAQPGVFKIEDTLKISNILFWVEKGNLQYVSNVNGGGSNLAGAVVGGVVAGVPGAVIASRNQVSTEIKEYDDREILIKMIDGKEYHFSYGCREGFSACIPEKEYTYLQMLQQQK